MGEGRTLTFNNVTVPTAGTYALTIIYCDGSATGRQATVSVDVGPIDPGRLACEPGLILRWWKA